MKLVIIESPYRGDIEANTAFARRCVRDSLMRGEAPIASHLLYTQPDVLNDDVPTERAWGINAGHAWLRACDLVAVYNGRGTTRGMHQAITAAEKLGVPIEYRPSLNDGGG